MRQIHGDHVADHYQGNRNTKNSVAKTSRRTGTRIKARIIALPTESSDHRFHLQHVPLVDKIFQLLAEVGSRREAVKSGGL